MKIESVIKVKKHIPYKIIKYIIKMKEPKRDKYSLSVDFSKDFPLEKIKQILLDYADKINQFMEDIELNPYDDLQSKKEIDEFKETFIEKMIYFFKDSELVELFHEIECMNFNTDYHNCLRGLPGCVLKTSKTLSTMYRDKKDCLKLYEDLRSFFDATFLCKWHTRVYGIYEHNEKYDREKMQWFFEKEIFSNDFINELETEERTSYFQKYGNHHYFGVVSYKIVQEELSKFKTMKS